jgi:hypothetical protein
MPVWSLLFSLLIALIYAVPAGIIFAMTSTQVRFLLLRRFAFLPKKIERRLFHFPQVSVNLIVELIAGYVIPGRALANMVSRILIDLNDRSLAEKLSRSQLFKTYAVTTVSATLTFVQDLKIGHYMKIPPRATFFGKLRFSRRQSDFRAKAVSTCSSNRFHHHHLLCTDCCQEVAQ